MPRTPPFFDSFDKAYKPFLEELLSEGRKIKSAEGRWVARELIGHNFAISNPRNRILTNEERDVNVYQYIGQFLWILQGNYHVDAISYYVDAASKRTSDNVRNTGAYGFRLFGPGYLNQINDIVLLLAKNKTSRRAVASVYMPSFDTDKTNHRDEIPCTLNLQFLVRDDKLDLVAYMRSQDVQKVLPYDVFLFTMLQEYVAAKLQVDVGNYFHMSGSFHIYEEDIPWIKKCLKDKSIPSGKMPKMPTEEPEYHANKNLIMFENEFRSDIIRKQIENKKDFDSEYYLEKLDKMPNYWRQWGLVLMMRGCVKLKNLDRLKHVTTGIKQPFKMFAEREIKKLEAS